MLHKLQDPNQKFMSVFLPSIYSLWNNICVIYTAIYKLSTLGLYMQVKFVTTLVWCIIYGFIYNYTYVATYAISDLKSSYT